MKLTSKYVAPLALVVLAVTVSVAMNQFKPAPPKLESPDTALPVETFSPKERVVQFHINTQGTVEPRTRTTLVSEVSGRVEFVAEQFVSGGVVKQGDVLLRLDPSDYRVALHRAEAELASKKAQFVLEQAKATQAKKEWRLTGQPLNKAPVLALRQPYLDEARANVQRAEAELQQAQVKLARTRIRAPYDAIVVDKLVDVGHYVSTATEMGEVFAVDRVEVRLPLTDSDLALMGLSLPMVASDLAVTPLPVQLSATVAGKSQQWQATIVRSEGVVDTRNRSHYLIASITDPYGLKSARPTALVIGSFVNARIQSPQQHTLFVVPRNAVLEGSQLALVDAHQRLHLQGVYVQHRDDQFAYIASGIDEGQSIIVSPVGLPIEGMKVKPVAPPSISMRKMPRWL
ncbi:efflux RND transporter periplasmic adaptor subunit [Oceanicoccus sagamiensis]|uniref:Multidrug resistance protein MdtA-like barrel-sandwich hybrid domain-containing protein n=1 Tax=Oceanicoccus sagamiensis TaxID=716816 RepID=A0A1X9NAD3_9GAMM|nr:efflux RND transporter periplasmic adaptor subunit [Oceanicoccus sagamiensis]ARN75010.1 hypothetical protein BST96_13345 [Oceanicoccus sagamiensis]